MRRRAFLRLLSDNAAAAVVEFALLIPVMLTLLMGSLNLGEAMGAQYKAEIAARNVADLAS